MSLLTVDLLYKLPRLYANEKKGLKAKAVARFLLFNGSWEWYASEGSFVGNDGNCDSRKEIADFMFFGVVVGHECEMGYFALSELESLKTEKGQGLIFRDLDFEPVTLEQLMTAKGR